jgi:hypothetical protein
VIFRERTKRTEGGHALLLFCLDYTLPVCYNVGVTLDVGGKMTEVSEIQTVWLFGQEKLKVVSYNALIHIGSCLRRIWRQMHPKLQCEEVKAFFKCVCESRDLNELRPLADYLNERLGEIGPVPVANAVLIANGLRVCALWAHTTMTFKKDHQAKPIQLTLHKVIDALRINDS